MYYSKGPDVGILKYFTSLFKRSTGKNRVAAVHKSVEVNSTGKDIRKHSENCRGKNRRAVYFVEQKACERPNRSYNGPDKRKHHYHQRAHGVFPNVGKGRRNGAEHTEAHTESFEKFFHRSPAPL